MTNSRRVIDLIGPWIDAALDGAAEDGRYEVGVLPNPQGIPTLTIIFWFPSPLLGQAITSAMMINNPLTLDQPGITDAVRGVVEAARQQRSQLLSQSDGHGPSGPGLIDPTQR